MGFDEYQKRASATDIELASMRTVMSKRNINTIGFLDKALGISGEAGEFADKIKKILRDKNGTLDEADRIAIKKELGDVLWYTAEIALYLDIPLSEVAQDNLEKLASRQRRGKLHGSGDER